MQTVDDITLKHARSGRRDAKARVLETMQDHWFRFCLMQLRDSHRAEDATQETAMRVLQSLDRFDGRSSFKTWSFGIALNVCRELRRKQLRHGAADFDDVGEPIDSNAADDAGVQMDAIEQNAALRNVLASLPARQREVVTLRYLEEMSVQDTANAMGCAEGTVKATLFAALRAIREKLTGGKADVER